MNTEVSFETAIHVQPSEHAATYFANLQWAWSVGTAPNGGYIAAIAYRVAVIHFQTTHPERHHSCAKPIAMQLSYIRRCHIGAAQFLVKDINLGSRISRVHVTLIQRGLPTVTGYLTISDEISEIGVTLPTKFNFS